MIEAQTSVFFIGDVSLDDYFTADRWPGVADKGYVTPLRSYVGGMVANAACVYAGLGGRPEFISLLNDSPVSQQLCRALNDSGVATRHMLCDPAQGDSRNFIVLVGGDHVVLTIDIGRAPMWLSDQAVRELMSPGYLYTTLIRSKRIRMGERQGSELLAELRAAGRRLVFDLDVEGFQPADAELLRGADAVIMNQVGFEHAFGPPGSADIGDWLRHHEVGTLILTLAADGAEAFDANGVHRVRGFSVPVVDVTGAGDTFGGAFVFGLTRGWDIAENLEFAIAASARAVTIEGPQGGVADADDIAGFAARYGRPLARNG